jgi:hypothetical protein
MMAALGAALTLTGLLTCFKTRFAAGLRLGSFAGTLALFPVLVMMARNHTHDLLIMIVVQRGPKDDERSGTDKEACDVTIRGLRLRNTEAGDGNGGGKNA